MAHADIERMLRSRPTAKQHEHALMDALTETGPILIPS